MATTEAAIWERIIRPDGGEMSKDTAKAILRFTISDDDRKRRDIMLGKAKAGLISPAEVLDLDEFERCGNVLSILKAKARRILKSRS